LLTKKRKFYLLREGGFSKKSYQTLYIKTEVKTDLFGFYNYKTAFNKSNYKFNLLSTIIYDALFINCKNGYFKNLNGWDTSVVLTAAKEAGCNIAFTAMIEKKEDVSTFLKQNNLQKNFTDKAITLLQSKMQMELISISEVFRLLIVLVFFHL